MMDNKGNDSMNTEQENLERIKQDVLNILYIENPSEAVQLAAVKQNGWIIQFIENRSEAVQQTAK